MSKLLRLPFARGPAFGSKVRSKETDLGLDSNSEQSLVTCIMLLTAVQLRPLRPLTRVDFFKMVPASVAPTVSEDEKLLRTPKLS